jgi:hypothetical protein
LALALRRGDPSDRRSLDARKGLAVSLARQGRREEALLLCREQEEAVFRDAFGDAAGMFRDMRDLAALFAAAGGHAEAEALARDAAGGLAGIPGAEAESAEASRLAGTCRRKSAVSASLASLVAEALAEARAVASLTEGEGRPEVAEAPEAPEGQGAAEAAEGQGAAEAAEGQDAQEGQEGPGGPDDARAILARELAARLIPGGQDPADPRAVALAIRLASACLAAGDAEEARRVLGEAAGRLAGPAGGIEEGAAREAARLAEALLDAGADGAAADLLRALHADRMKRLGSDSPEARAREEAIARALAALEGGEDGGGGEGG